MKKGKSKIDKLKREAVLSATVRRSASSALPLTPPAPQLPAPDELISLWNEEIEAAFCNLNERQKKFLLIYMKVGIASEAYRQAYNPLASNHLASVCGAEVLANPGMFSILQRLTQASIADLLQVKKTFREMTEATRPQWQQDRDGQWENAGDVPDWKARKDGADGLARIDGMYAPLTANVNAKMQSQVLIIELPAKDPEP